MTAYEKLLEEFPELKTWPKGEVADMLGSTSPYMTKGSADIQARFYVLLKEQNRHPHD